MKKKKKREGGERTIPRITLNLKNSKATCDPFGKIVRDNDWIDWDTLKR